MSRALWESAVDRVVVLKNDGMELLYSAAPTALGHFSGWAIQILSLSSLSKTESHITAIA